MFFYLNFSTINLSLLTTQAYVRKKASDKFQLCDSYNLFSLLLQFNYMKFAGDIAEIFIIRQKLLFQISGYYLKQSPRLAQ